MRHCLVRRTALTTILALSACARPSPIAILARAPRVGDGTNTVRLVEDPCSSHGELLAPVDVRGVKTWLLVDSGAYRHVLTPATVQRAKVEITEDVELVGGGAGVAASVLGDAGLELPGVGAIDSRRVLRLPIPGADACGIGGVLSPARLADEGTWLLDLPARRLARDARLGGEPTFEAPRLGYPAYAADTKLFDTSSRLLVDTGSCCTWVHLDTAVGRALLPRAERLEGGPSNVFAVSATHHVREVPVRVGKLTRSLEVFLLPGSGVQADGALGIDALSSCALAFDKTALRARCTP